MNNKTRIIKVYMATGSTTGPLQDGVPRDLSRGEYGHRTQGGWHVQPGGGGLYEG